MLQKKISSLYEYLLTGIKMKTYFKCRRCKLVFEGDGSVGAVNHMLTRMANLNNEVFPFALFAKHFCKDFPINSGFFALADFNHVSE